MPIILSVFVKLIVLTQNDIKSLTLYCSFQNESINFFIRIGIKIFISSIKFVIFRSQVIMDLKKKKKICSDVFMDFYLQLFILKGAYDYSYSVIGLKRWNKC
jgi:hypothetical protein